MFSVVALSFGLCAPVQAGIPVLCENCSTETTTEMQLIKDIQQVIELVEQTKQAIHQTEMQLKNLERIGEDLADNPLDYLMELAELTGELNTYRDEQKALAQIFNELYPEQSYFADLAANATAEEIEAVNKKYQDHYDEWSRQIDEATMATFQVTGRQLKELEDSGELQDYLENLLRKPEGHMQALEAANQLAARQIEEIRQFRELTATQAQHQALNEMKQEKIDEMTDAQWREASKVEDSRRNSKSAPIRNFVPWR